LSSIRFNGSAGQPVKPEVLNHQTASPFQKHNIQLHVGSSYLKDFSDAGIEKFIESQPGASKLDKAEVKAFVQRLAQNPEALAGMTIDLADPQIGLAKGDGVELRHLNGAFTLNLIDKKHLPEGSSSQNVKFVDVTAVSFDVFEQEKAIKQAEQNLKTLEGQLEQVKKSHTDVKDERDTAAGRIGDKSQDQLKEAHAKLKESEEQLAALEGDLKRYKGDLEALKANKDMPAADKAKQQTLLERAIRGAESEKTRFQKQKQESEAQLKDKHGNIFVKSYSLEDLEKLNTRVTNSEARVQSVQQQVDKAKAELEALRKGGKPATAPADTAAPTPATPAAETPAATAPAKPVPSNEDFAKMDVDQKTLALAEMSVDDQKKFIALLSTEDKTQVARRATYLLENIKQTQTLPPGTAQGLTRETQIAKFEKLVQQFQTSAAPSAPAPATPANPSTPAETPTGSADPAAPATPAPATPAPATPAAPAAPSAPAPATPAPGINPGEGIAVAEPVANMPPDTLLSGGKPLTFQGQILTLSNFSQLAIHQQFDILMKVDEAQLKATLKLVKKEDRSQIRALAGAVVSQAAAQQSQSIAAVTGGSGNVSTGGGLTFQGVNLSSYMNSAGVQRAQLIIQLLNEIEMEENGQSVPSTGPAAPTSPTGSAAGSRYQYQVQRGDTPLSIAKRELGNELRVHEIFQLNPGLEALMKQRGVGNNHGEKLDAYQEEYRQLILSRTALPKDPVTSAPPRAVAPANPVVEVVAPVTPAPVAPAPVTPAPAKAAAPAKPATPAAVTPAKVEAPAAAPAAPTAKLEEEAPAPAKVETPAPPVAPAPAKVETPAAPVAPAAKLEEEAPAPAKVEAPLAAPVTPAPPAAKKPAPKRPTS
jgi:hypothetical protein